jgi:hypothetical protein
MSLKRVNKEIEKIKTFKCNEHVRTFFDKLKFAIIFDEVNILQIELNNKILLRLMIPGDYPFKPYKIYYHDLVNDNYGIYLSKINKNKNFDPMVLDFFYTCLYGVKPKFLKLNHNACYCCNSLTCYTNWSPALTLMNVLLEYTEVAFIKKYSKWYNYIYLESIYSCLNINYFSKLPDEIIEIIFENLT